MSNIGISSSYLAYTTSISAYGTNQTLPVKDKQETSDTEILPKHSSNNINDEAIISDEAKKMLEAEQNQYGSSTTSTTSTTQITGASGDSSKKLTPEQEQEIAKLKARDAEVKAHEQAHLAAASGINASAPVYDYQMGPDGKEYAVGGEVTVSFQQSNDPEENLSNAETMKAAALAPAQPSSQDRAAAAAAEKMIEEAEKEITQQKEESVKEPSKTDETKNAPSDNEQENKTES